MTSILIFKCTEGADVGDYSFLPNRPHPLSSFDTHARWQPVTQSARSRWSCGKIEDCEQSTFDYSLDRYCSIIHSRFRLDSCALFYYLFKTAVLSSPICSCGFGKETKSHFFLHCPKYASPRKKNRFLLLHARVFLTNGRDTLTLKRWMFSYLAPLIYQQKKTLNYFFTLNNLLKSPNAFVFFILKALFTRDVICMLYVKCRCKPSRWVLQWALGANMY